MYQFLSYMNFYCSNVNTPQDYNDDGEDAQDSDDKEGVIDSDGSSSSKKAAEVKMTSQVVVMTMTKMMMTSLPHWLEVLLPIPQDVGDQVIGELDIM